MHVVALEKKASTCRSKGAKGEWIEKVYDCVIAYNSLKGKSRCWRWWKILSRGRTKQCPLWLKEKKGDAGIERAEALPKVLTVEEGCQEEAQKKKAKKKGRWMRTVEKEDPGMKSLKKWLRASTRRQARSMMMPRRLRKELLGKVSGEAGTARKSKTMKRKKRNSGKKEKQMELQWAEDENLEESSEQRIMERCSLQAEVTHKAPEFVVHERMSQRKGVKGKKEKKKVKGWSTEGQAALWRKTQKK